MADAELKRIDSYQYPSAHLGHLTEGQQATLDNFKRLCEAEGYYKPAGLVGSEASHDDETLLRYLRARKFISKDAFVQFKDTEDWRKENKLEELYETIDIQEYEETRRLYPQWTGRRDRRGIPVYVFEVSHLNSKRINAYDQSISGKSNTPLSAQSKVPPKMLRLFALYENLTRFVMPLCSAITDRNHPETPISQSNNIVDISKVGLKQFWNLKSHMQDASTLATAHYPETLDRIFIIGAPAFFPTVWGWIKRWFDPITVSKIFILSSSNMQSTLEQYIDPANIPKKYGGQLDFEFGMMPILEPAIESALKWKNPSTQNSIKTFPTGPIRWEENGDGSTCALAVGSRAGKPRHDVVASLPAGTGPKAMHGELATVNTPIDEKELALYTTGTSTQQEVEEQAEYTETPPDMAPTPPQTLPYREGTPAHNAASADQTAPMRQGTSTTRYEQQDATHASGQLADGTPAVNNHGHGDKTVTMEPDTIGQAPKDVSVPPAEDDKPAPSYLDQAKSATDSAYQGATAVASTTMSAVGMGGKKESEPQTKTKEEEKPMEDPRIENARPAKVEEYLRGQYESKSTPTVNQ